MHQERKSELIRNYPWRRVICSGSSYLILAMIRHSAFKTPREQTIAEISSRLASCGRRAPSPEVARDNFGGRPSLPAAPLFLALPSHRGGPLLLRFAFSARRRDEGWRRGDGNRSQGRCAEVL